MSFSNLTDYIHVDDHHHNDLTARYLRHWLIRCVVTLPNERKIWFAQLNLIPLRHYVKDDDVAGSNRKPKKAEANTSTEWRGFVNVELSEEEWAAVDKEVADKQVFSRLPSHLDYLLELGKVTFNYTNGSISCALTILEGVQKGFTVSSFSDNAIEALVTTRLKVQNHLAEFEAIFTGSGGNKRKRG